MRQGHRFDLDQYMVRPGTPVTLDQRPTAAPPGALGKAEAAKALAEDVTDLAEAQELIWASGSHAVLIILQALDAAGKDGTIKHVMSGVNPQGCSVHSFKAPTEEEASHHFLWRPVRVLPGRGRIAIFNRSYYEEVLVTRVHPGFLERQGISLPEVNTAFWSERYDDINAFEHSLSRSRTCIIKIFLHISKKEQRQRLLDRLNDPDKHWKFSPGDVVERAMWREYRKAYQDALEVTSTAWAPWYVVPADDKWFARACVADIITSRVAELKLTLPTVSELQRQKLEESRRLLEAEPLGDEG